jgi:N-acetylmuramic acid 6-phosphate etherase
MRPLHLLTTEQLNPRTMEMDLLPIEAALERINDEDALVAPAVRAQIPAIARGVELVERALRRGGRLLYVGAGTSGRLGCLDAAEIPPTFGLPPDRIVGIIAGGDQALRHSVEGAEDSPDAGVAAMRDAGVGPADVVCGIAASGRTPYVLGALREARSRGAATIAVTTNSPSELDTLADVLVAPVVGPEPVSGSTRMKSGTAQKLVLNMLTTMAMVRLGKTYGNLMVDVRPTNEKLVERARRLIREVTGVGPEEAAGMLDAAGGETKTAILMALTGEDAAVCRRRLEAAGGVLRRALGESPRTPGDQ